MVPSLKWSPGLGKLPLSMGTLLIVCFGKGVGGIGVHGMVKVGNVQ